MMRKRGIIVTLILAVLVMGTTYGAFSKSVDPQITITNPQDGDSLKIGENINIYVNTSGLGEIGRHRVWFRLEVRRTNWAETEWSVVPTSSPNSLGDNTAFPTQMVNAKDRSWKGLAVVWDTSLPITHQGREEQLSAGDYCVRIGIAESIHHVHDPILSSEIRVSLVTEPTPPGPTLGTTPQPEIVPEGVIRIAPYTKGPYYTNETIIFRIMTPEEPGNMYKTFMWDFGDGTNSSEISPAHQYLAKGGYTVRLIAWRETERSPQGKVESEPYKITVLPSPPPVTASRTVMGFPSLDTASSMTILPGFDLPVLLSLTVHKTGVNAFIVREQIPENWNLIDGSVNVAGVSDVDWHTVTGVEGRKSTTWIEWFFAGPFDKDQTITINYALSPSPDISLGDYTLTGQVAVNPRFTQDITGDSAIKLVQYLPLKVVIAHIDAATASKICVSAGCISSKDFKLETDSLGMSASRYTITAEQYNAAICLWKHGCVVPYTNGETISYISLLELTDAYQLGKHGIP